MKKLFAILLSVTIVASLAACGGSAPAAPAGDAGNAAAAPSAEVVDAGGTVTVWCWDPAFNIYAMNEAGKVYKAENANFELNVIETPWDDLQTKLTTAATSDSLDTLPDIFLCQDNAFQKNVINFEEAFTDITSSGIAFNQFASAKVAYSVVDGKNYGVPFDNGTAINCLRTDVLQEAGYTVADFTDITWDKYIELGSDVLAKTGKPLLSGIAGESDLIMMMLQSAGSSLFNADGTPNIANNAELVEVMRVYNELVKSGVMVEINNWDEYISTFVNGSVAGTINGCWILGSIQTAEDQAGNWAITNLPKLNVASGTNYSNNGGSSWAISSSSKNKDLAIDFLSKTFAGSVPFYETILPSAGALATYLPAGSSAVYGEPQSFFGGQKIYEDITTFAGKVPSNITGVYYYEARDAVATAMTQIVSGADMTKALNEAEDTVKFKMG